MARPDLDEFVNDRTSRSTSSSCRKISSSSYSYAHLPISDAGILMLSSENVDAQRAASFDRLRLQVHASLIPTSLIYIYIYTIIIV